MNILISVFAWLIGLGVMYLIVCPIWVSVLGRPVNKLYFWLLHFCMASVLVLLVFWLYDLYLTHNLLMFDLNQDGMFDVHEATHEQRQALDNWINDSGKNLIRVASIPIYFFVDFLIYKLARVGRTRLQCAA